MKVTRCSNCGSPDLAVLEDGKLKCSYCGAVFRVARRLAEHGVQVRIGSHAKVKIGANAKVSIRGSVEIAEDADVEVDGTVEVIEPGDPSKRSPR